MSVINPTDTNVITPSNLPSSANGLKAREIDFVTRFENNWEELRQVLSMTNFIKKTPGATIKVKKCHGTLNNDTVNPGALIPYSAFEIEEIPVDEMTVEKYAKAVSVEAINTYGYDNAVQLTDEEFMYMLQDNVEDKFFTHINGGSLHPTPAAGQANAKYATFQSALAAAKGLVVNKFKKLHKRVSNIVAFVNALDVYDYLGTADITIQTTFGFNYVQNFMGYSVVMLLSDDQIARGRVIATAVENLNIYYVDPSESDFARAGLSYTTSGDTNLIGFHVDADYARAQTVNYAIMGMKMYSEYIDGVAVIDVGATYTNS